MSMWIAGWALLAGADAPPQPMVLLNWRGSESSLRVAAPEGFTVAEDAPSSVVIRTTDREVEHRVLGDALVVGVPLGPVQGRELTGALEVSLCAKESGVCTPGRYDLWVLTAELKRGATQIEVRLPSESEDLSHATPWKADAAATVSGVFAEARLDGKRVLLDFGAVWCPPCNLLAAEVLHTESPHEILGSVHIAELDVDDPTSFETKDRYGVGGYPTLVVTEADGTEVSRLVGYPGKEAFVEWLEAALRQDVPDTDFSTVDPASVSPEQAAEVAWLMVQNRKDPIPWIERAEGVESLSLRLARVQVQPNLQDATWLADNAPGKASVWVYGASSLAKEAEGASVLRRALETELRGANGPEAADLLYLLAEVAHEEDAPMLYGAAAATLRTSLVGDPELDRGHITWLAVLQERSGDLRGAVRLLTEYADRYPNEPTFFEAAAKRLYDRGEFEASLEQSTAALAVAWGDNRLRVAELHCLALRGLERGEEARIFASDLLVKTPPPNGDLQVRTGRYRTALSTCAENKD